MNKLVKYLTIIVFLSSALTLSAQSDEKAIRKGNRNYKSGNYEEAIAKYREALEIRPNNAKAQFNLGDVYYAKQSYDTAYAEFQKVLEISPDAKLKSDAVYNMGNCLLAQDKYYDAFNVYKVSLKLNPENENALYNLEYCRAHLVKSEVWVVQPEHGTVEAKEKMAFNGQRVTLTSRPDEDYALSEYIVARADNMEVKVDVSGSSFIMPKFDVMVTAVFKPSHKIEIDKDIKHGTVRADRQKAVEGQSVKLEAQGEDDYVLDKYTVYRTGNVKDTIPVNKDVFQMPNFDVTVTATFRTALKVSIDSVANGTISVTDSLVKPGQDVGIIVRPNKGYQLGDLQVVSQKDATESAPVSDDNMFQMLDSDVTVKATFVEATDYDKVQPDTVFTHFWGDVNMDHQNVYKSTLVTVRPVLGQAVKDLYCYRVPSSTEWTPNKADTMFMPNYFVDIEQYAEQKYKAFACYSTELRDYPHPRSVQYLRESDKAAGLRVGLLAAEEFVMLRKLV